MNSQTHEFPEKKVVWVEVPKTGCTSVKWSLKAFKGMADLKDQPDHFHSKFGWTHLESEGIEESIIKRYDGWKRFTVVRDPVDRFVSLYNNIYGCLNLDKDDPYRLNWKGKPCYSIDDFIVNFKDSGWYENPHGRPQSGIIGTDLSVYDYVGRTEDMAGVCDFLSGAFGVKIEPSHKYKGNGEVSHLTIEQRKAIEELFIVEYELFPWYDKSTSST